MTVTKKVAAPARDVHQVVTDQMVALLEQGVRPWSASWRGANALVRPLKVDGKPYQGINVLILWMTGMLKGYDSQYWMTYNRAQALGGQVRKGEKSTMVVLYKSITIEKGSDAERNIPILRGFSVFNASQIDGLPEKFLGIEPPQTVPMTIKERIPRVEEFFDALKCDIKHGGSNAFYVLSEHRIQMPKFEDFFTAEAYYITRGHETIHWTKHESLLDRKFDDGRWDSDAMEELVAELGTAFLSADFQLINHPREDHASYLASWLKALQNDKKAIFIAASNAEKAVKLLHDIANPAQSIEHEDSSATA